MVLAIRLYRLKALDAAEKQRASTLRLKWGRWWSRACRMCPGLRLLELGAVEWLFGDTAVLGALDAALRVN